MGGDGYSRGSTVLTEGDGLTRRAVVAAAAPAVAIAVVVLFPFVGKAFTIDDVVFLLQAEHILRDPLHPTAFDMVFHGSRIRMSLYHVTGPVMGFLHVPIILLGKSEVIAHLVQLGFLLTGALATVRLALLLGCAKQQATLAAVLVTVSPGVLGMAATSMPDVPAMAFGVLALERVTTWKRSLKWTAGVSSVILLALAAMTRPQQLLLLPLAALWLAVPMRRSQPRFTGALLKSLIPVFAAALLLVAVNRVSRDPQTGADIARSIVASSGSSAFWGNFSSFLLNWAVAFPLTILWAALRGQALVRSPFAWVGLSAGVAVAFAGGSLPLVGFIAVTGAVLADVFGDAWQRRDYVQGFLGLWLLTAAATAPYGHLPAKFLVPSAPAMGLVIARLSRGHLSKYRPLIATISVLGVLLGVLIVRADSALAEIGRIGGRQIAQLVRRGETVWVDGAWGFQWYGIAAGARPLALTPPLPKSGDIVVSGTQARVLVLRYSDKTLLHRQVFDRPGGRVLSEGAGFFSNGFGPLPWVWGTEELGRIETWRLGAVPSATR